MGKIHKIVNYIKTIKIPVGHLYHGYKPSLVLYYEKYFCHEGNPLLWINTPICKFAVDYVKKGKKVFHNLDDCDFIKYEYERYSDAPAVKNDTHKTKAAHRVIKIIESIRKHGYAEGKFKHQKYLINVIKGFKSPYGDDSHGYTLWTRKHRAAACVALGMKKITVKVYK